MNGREDGGGLKISLCIQSNRIDFHRTSVADHDSTLLCTPESMQINSSDLQKICAQNVTLSDNYNLSTTDFLWPGQGKEGGWIVDGQCFWWEPVWTPGRPPRAGKCGEQQTAFEECLGYFSRRLSLTDVGYKVGGWSVRGGGLHGCARAQPF